MAYARNSKLSGTAHDLWEKTREVLEERGVQIRTGLEKKSGFVQWAAMTALLLAVFLLGVFRAGYIPSGFIYTQF